MIDRVSIPAPPFTTSLPWLPSIISLPPPPLIVSLPKKPRNISDRAVPVFLSLPLVPCQTIEGAFEIGPMSFPILFKAIPRQTKLGGAF
ncbi:MAG TPA: hypothetical protein DEF16_13790 [Gemmobacter sp.]|nr:hypothetical protein [Gemmobacter sp.]